MRRRHQGMKTQRDYERLAETSRETGNVDVEMLKVLLGTIAQTGRSGRGLDLLLPRK